MPTYTYRCDNCGHQFDIYQGFADQPLKACPKCKKRLLHKIYQPSGVSFKGSGFYVTDKRSAVPTPTKATGGKENGKGESKTEKGETKTEKGAAKAETKSETAGEKSKPKAKEE